MPRRKGFTLVELLVVIGIIAVLIGILMPSLNSARRQSRNIKCLSNLRQLGLGFQQYELKFKGAWPVARHEQNLPAAASPTGQAVIVSNRWVDRIAEQITGLTMVNMASMSNTSSTNPNAANRLREMSVLWGCPEWAKIDEENFNNAGGDYIRIGYSMQVFPFAPEVSATPRPAKWQFISWNGSSGIDGRFYKASQWTKPSDRLLLAEGPQDYIDVALAIRTPGSMSIAATWYPFPATTAANLWVDGARHAKSGVSKETTYRSKFTNALFCDGHAESVSVAQAWNAIINPGKNTAQP